MSRRESRQTCTHSTTDIAIQATDDASESEKEPQKQEEVYDFNSPFLFSDMVLLVEDEKLHCHRAILSLYSPVFKAMFQSRFEETSANQVSLPKDEAATVRELLRHLYTPGGCDMDSAAAQRLLPLIHRFQIESLITTAERTMTFSMTDSMAPKMLALADLYQLNHLKQAAIDACTRLDMNRMTEALEETPLSPELKATIFGKRVCLLEKAISDIERSFSQSCIRMESKLERVFTNHCQLHNKPLSNTTVPISFQLNNSGRGDADRLVIRPVTGSSDNGQAAPDASRLATAAAATPRLTTRILQSPGATRSAEVDASASQEDAAGEASAVTTAVVEVPAICEGCVDRISMHIKEICRRALHKAHFVPYKPPATALANTPPT
ncbi:unnamed protein product [Mesocestoides corti]|uniref:BTB domain-containing protein n=1 Tax=Mesocestoides corti TaxID=53468 RepID=A0A0R3ULR6_MESCO|nr:unnamed protein product [Mesocestoides corti]